LYLKSKQTDDTVNIISDEEQVEKYVMSMLGAPE